MSDVEEQRRLQTYEALLSSIEDFVYLFDAQGRFTYVNRPLLDLWGIDLSGAIGKTFEELGYPPELVALHRAQIEQVVATRRPLRAHNAYTNSAGQTGYYEYIFVPVLEGGDVVAVAGVTRDITEHRRAAIERERLLADLDTQRRWLQAVLDQMPSGLVIAEVPSGRLLVHNRAAVRLLGHPVRESEPFSEYAGYGAVHDDGSPYAPEEYPITRAVRYGETVQQHEMWYRRSDGTTAYFSVNAAPIRNEQGAIVAAVGTFQDISVQKLAREELQRAHQRTVEILESIDDAFYALDREWRFAYLNQRTEQLWGRKREDLIGKVIWDEFPQLAGSETQAKAREAMTERRVIHFETRSPLIGIWISISLYPSTIGLSIYFRDITERREMEEQLRRSEAHYRLLFESNPHSMWVYDPETLRFRDVNGAAEAEFGYERAEFLQMTLFDIRPEEEHERLRAALRQPSETLDRFEAWRLRKKDGTVIEAEVASHLIRLDGVDARLAVVLDVTERNRVARENRDRREELEMLLQLSLDLARHRDLDELCRTVARSVPRSLPHANAATLWLYDEEKQALRTGAWSGHDEALLGLSVPADAGLLGAAMHRRDLVAMPEPSAVLHLPAHPELDRVHAALAVPLLADHVNLGVLLAECLVPGLRFLEREARVLQAIAAQAALALQNTRLFEELRAISRRLLMAEENERRRIAQELHDEVGAMLTSLQLSLRLNPAREATARRELDEAEAIVGSLLEQIRQLSLTLRPSVLDDLGLVPALLWLFDRFEARTKVQVAFSAISRPRRASLRTSRRRSIGSYRRP